MFARDKVPYSDWDKEHLGIADASWMVKTHFHERYA